MIQLTWHADRLRVPIWRHWIVEATTAKVELVMLHIALLRHALIRQVMQVPNRDVSHQDALVGLQELWLPIPLGNGLRMCSRSAICFWVGNGPCRSKSSRSSRYSHCLVVSSPTANSVNAGASIDAGPTRGMLDAVFTPDPAEFGDGRDANRRRFDVLLCWRLDRLGRNLRHLVTLIEELQTLGIAFVSLGEGIDCATPAGKLQLHILAALSRVRAGANTRASSGGLTTGQDRGKEATGDSLHFVRER